MIVVVRLSAYVQQIVQTVVVIVERLVNAKNSAIQRLARYSALAQTFNGRVADSNHNCSTD